MDFEPEVVFAGYPYNAMRRVDFDVLLSPNDYRNCDVPDQLKLVRDQWHSRLTRLRKASSAPWKSQKRI